MPVSYPEIRKFVGLFLQANSFDVPDGAMEICQNVEIQSDAILQKTKGWYKYWEPGPGDELKALITYQDHLLSFSTDGIRYFVDDTGTDTYSPIGTATLLTGDATDFSYTVRSEKENLNLYFTSNNGIYKLESFNGKVRKSGVPPALDLRATEGSGATGPLPPDSQTAYRIVFGRRDTNGNLLLGSPSDIATVGINPDDTGVTYTSSGAGPYAVNADPGVASGLRIGDQIIVTNGTDTDVNGTQTINLLSPPLATNHFGFDTVANPGAGTFDYTFSREAELEFSIPSEINDATDMWFYQVYRTTSSAGVLVSPSPDFKLIAEVPLTATDISLGFVFFTDDVDPIFAGAELYTNPNSREGELQANARPPLAEDIALYKNYMLYAATTTRQRLSLSLIDITAISGNTVTFKYLTTEEDYLGSAAGVRNQSVSAESVAGTGTVTITYTAHSASNGWTVSLEEVTGSVPRGTYVISGVTANTFDITSAGNSATAITFSFLTNGTDPVFKVDTSSASLAQQIANTTYYLVKSINRTSAFMYANSTSTFDDAPGKFSIQSKVFLLDSVIYVKTTTGPSPFIPPAPTSFSSAQQLYSQNDVFPDGIYISKFLEPDAVPLLSFLRVGSKNAAIKRIFTLRDSVIILKEDGIFKLTGDTVDQFSVTILDSTVFAISFMGADKINNNVLAITNQGVVSISESSVQIISRRIDDIIQFTLSVPGTLDISCGWGFETARTWYFSIASSIKGRTPETYLYNVLNQTWTSCDLIFRNMALGPDDVAFAIAGQEANFIYRQRNSETLIDYSGEFCIGAAQATSDLLGAYLTISGGNIFVPAAGDIILYNSVINRIETVTVNGGGYDVTFITETNLLTASAEDVSIYKAFQSSVKFSPFHAGQVQREKQFSQFQLHLRQNVITNLQLSFATESFGSSESVDWMIQTISTAQDGWGLSPWGLFPWGLSSGIDLQAGTYPSAIIRTYIPLFAGRSTFIQPILTHLQAAEPLFIQALGYVVRGYGERVTR